MKTNFNNLNNENPEWASPARDRKSKAGGNSQSLIIVEVNKGKRKVKPNKPN